MYVRFPTKNFPYEGRFIPFLLIELSPITFLEEGVFSPKMIKVKSVLKYDEVLDVHFGQASICIDACFILAFLDSNDPRGDLVGNVLEKWQKDGIAKIGIPVIVFNEVVHNLFKNYVLKAVVSAGKIQYNSSNKGRKISLNDEEKIVGEEDFAKKLLRFAPNKAVLEIINGRRYSIPVSDMIKDFKKNFPNERPQLTPMYQHSIQKINEFISILTNDFGFMVDILGADESTKDAAVSYMALFQLEIYDAMHLASTYCNSYDYFATLDNDFVHNLYSGGTPKILNIA
jgi:predicted nucleic acid-binding protein